MAVLGGIHVNTQFLNRAMWHPSLSHTLTNDGDPVVQVPLVCLWPQGRAVWCCEIVREPRAFKCSKGFNVPHTSTLFYWDFKYLQRVAWLSRIYESNALHYLGFLTSFQKCCRRLDTCFGCLWVSLLYRLDICAGVWRLFGDFNRILGTLSGQSLRA